MASVITGNYSAGHNIVLKNKEHLSTTALKAIKGVYNPGDPFTMDNPNKDIVATYVFGTGNKELYLTDSNNKRIKIVGSISSIEGSFNHNAKSGKSNTEVLTEIKELISLWVMLDDIVSDSKENHIMSKLSAKQRDFYKSEYLISAIKQNKSIKQFGYRLNTEYKGERQATGFTKELYDKATKISKLHKDNWNPADVWFIKNSFMSTYKEFVDSIDVKTHSIDHVNQFIKVHIDSKNIVPVSLKHVDEDKAHTELVYFGMKLKNLDFNISYVDMDIDSFNNFIPWTKCNFAPRCGFKSSKTSLSVFIEGRMRNAGYQLGAVDKKVWVAYTQKLTGIKLIDSNPITPVDKNNIKYIEEIYKRVTIKKGGRTTTADQMIASYMLLDGLSKKRANNLISSMYMLLVAVPKKIGEAQFFEWLYLYSRKITEKACPYILSH